MERKGAKEEFEQKFSKIKKGSRENNVNTDPEICRFIWEKTLPIDDTVQQFQKNDEVFQPILGRFNIGAILFTREYWEKLGHFEVSMDDLLGDDEDQLIGETAVHGMVPILSTRTFAGHFAFKHQKEEMKNFWRENKSKFKTIDNYD